MDTATIKINGMTCMGCVASVKKVLGALEGVQSVEVTLEPPQATVVYDGSRAQPARMKLVIEDAGFETA